jgi:hypothetical protein
MSGQRRCFWHSKATALEAREARRRGGQARMLALAPTPGLAIVPAPAEQLPATVRAEPPTWWALERRDDVLGAVRDVGRAAILRRIDPRTANTALQAMQLLLQADAVKRADRRARRQYARDQLRGRFDDLLSELRRVRRPDDLGRVENLVKFMAELAGRLSV